MRWLFDDASFSDFVFDVRVAARPGAGFDFPDLVFDLPVAARPGAGFDFPELVFDLPVAARPGAGFVAREDVDFFPFSGAAAGGCFLGALKGRFFACVFLVAMAGSG